MGFFDKIKAGLKKTRDSITGQINSMLHAFTKIDEELFEELEELLVMADVGMNTATEICDTLRARVKERGITDPNEIITLLQEVVTEMVSGDNELHLDTQPSVILVIGVNGVGKTTTIGKLASRLKKEGKSVILGAADTFRAAAIEQLEVWAERADVPIIKHAEGADPAAVVYDTISAAKARHADVVICDTAGRLHNKKNLMDELSKISRIIDKGLPGCSKEVLLVLDATTGQNAVNQAREFKEAAGLTGIVLTKLDGTAKGGVVLAIHRDLGLPVKFIGVGEQVDDLQPFDAEDFARALFERKHEARRFFRCTQQPPCAESLPEGSGKAKSGWVHFPRRLYFGLCKPARDHEATIPRKAGNALLVRARQPRRIRAEPPQLRQRLGKRHYNRLPSIHLRGAYGGGSRVHLRIAVYADN